MVGDYMFNLKGRVAVVTGASSGLGKQMSHGLAEAGADLVIIARRYDRLIELKEELEKKGTKVLAIKCDVTNTEEINNAALLTEKEFKKVDILINCAGASRDKGVLDMTDEEWNFTIETDLTSVFKMTSNIPMDTIAYHSSKGGVINFTRECAAELAKYNITCNAICPGYFETELTEAVLNTKEFTEYMKGTVPVGRYGKSGELNAAAIFLASDEASYVTGAILPVDGGYTCV